MKEISDSRKGLYYLGGGVALVGFLLFASTFVSAALHFGDFDDFEARGKSMAIRAFGGMALLIVGGILRNVGARGLAGSGAVLDPKQARSDLEPFSRMAGGMAKDAMDEAGIDLSGRANQPPQRVVMIKCRQCGQLNEEDSKFCQECGQKL